MPAIGLHVELVEDVGGLLPAGAQGDDGPGLGLHLRLVRLLLVGRGDLWQLQWLLLVQRYLKRLALE